MTWGIINGELASRVVVDLALRGESKLLSASAALLFRVLCFVVCL